MHVAFRLNHFLLCSLSRAYRHGPALVEAGAATRVGQGPSRAPGRGPFFADEWLKQEQERQRRWSQEWKQSWAWDWASHRWTWGSGCFDWGGRGWWSQEPTALDSQKMAASSWEEDKDPTTFTTERVHEDMGTHRLKALTPLSFQPQRHITMILGRPVVVLNGQKIYELSNDK